MTLVLGLGCRDGVILAADSQWTEETVLPERDTGIRPA